MLTLLLATQAHAPVSTWGPRNVTALPGTGSPSYFRPWPPCAPSYLKHLPVPLHTSDTSLCPFIPQTLSPLCPFIPQTPPWAPSPSPQGSVPQPFRVCISWWHPPKNYTDPACLGSLPRHTPMPPVTERALGFVALSDRGKGLPWNWARGSSSHQVQGRFSSQPSFGYQGGSAKQSYKAGQMQTFEALWPLARELCCVKSQQLTLTAMSSRSMSTQLLLEESEWEKNNKKRKCKRLRRPLVSLMELALPLWIPGLDAVNVIHILPPLTKAERSARHMFGVEQGKIWRDSRAWKAKRSRWGRALQPLIFVRFTAFASCKDLFFLENC